MIHIAICDDDEKIIDELTQSIYKIMNNQVFISHHSNPFSLTTYVMDEAKGKVDLIFMDIHLKGQNGVYVAESILADYPTIKVIFMSDKLENVQDIFRINPIYFLRKPLQPDYVRDALYKTIRILDEEKTTIFNMGTGRGKNKIISVKAKEIYYIESDKRKVWIHMLDESYYVYAKLDAVEEELKSNFIRVHQSYIVNMDKVMGVAKDYVILYNNVTIPISRSRCKEVVDRINEYISFT